ncbi:MAG TPA: hypothetical protein VGI78_10730 [Acetobacteraceae bacterium]
MSGSNALAQGATYTPSGNVLDPQYLQWLQLASQHTGVAPGVLHSFLQSQSTDSPWVQNLKRLVQPNIDPRGVVQPQYQSTDPGLNRQGPQVGNMMGA